MIVVDASVFVKLFKSEADSDKARRLIDYLVDRAAPFFAPTVVLYESLSASLHTGHPFAEVDELFRRLAIFGLHIEVPTRNELMRAEIIATTKSPKGGYPTLFDSIYHAMAIERSGLLVTADRKHVEKSFQFGHVVLLTDWQPDLAPTPPPA